MTHDREFDDETSQVRQLLAECRARLSEREAITVTAADLAVRHLFSLGLCLSAMEELTEDLELRRRIEAAIEETDNAIAELRRLIFDAQNGPEPEV